MSAPVPRPGPAHAGRILLIDSDATTALENAQRLGASGWEVVAVSNAIRALRTLEIETFDAILCEIRLPRVDGFELRDTLLRDPSAATIPFFFLAADATREDHEIAARLSVHHILPKPVPFAAIRALVPVVNPIAIPEGVLVPPPPDALPEIVELEPLSDSEVVFRCSICSASYAVPDPIEDERLLSMCPTCVTRTPRGH